MSNVLIAYATSEGQTRKIAGRMAEFVSEYGHAATVLDAAGAPVLSRGRYDAVIVAASVHRGRHQAAAERFVRGNLRALQRLPGAFFSVSLSAAGKEPRHRRDARKVADGFLRRTGWKPALVRPVAGALAYTRYGPVLRAVLRLIAWREGGDTDTSRDWEYTDWERLRRDLELFLTHAVPPANEVDRRPVFAGEGI